MGIGTLINHFLPHAPVKHVMGSGVGYGALPDIDSRFVFHAVRGHGSAKALGLPAETVITDAAVLLRAVDWLPRPSNRPRINIVLTGESLRNFDWQPVCAAAGIGTIRCHETVEDVLSAIQGSDLILAEAMHGAIAADTLRVPWIPVTCNEHILGAKWQDWLSSLGLAYDPFHVQPLFDGNHGLGPAERIKRAAKVVLAKSGAYSAPRLNLQPRSSPAEVERAVQHLRLAARGRPMLSDVGVLDRCVERFQAKLRALRTHQPQAALVAR